jgi:hypothetical protein
MLNLNLISNNLNAFWRISCGRVITLTRTSRFVDGGKIRWPYVSVCVAAQPHARVAERERQQESRVGLASRDK